MKNDAKVNQHKRMAMGDNPTTKAFANGGTVPLKTGMRDSPIETAKRANGVPGMKKGGRC